MFVRRLLFLTFLIVLFVVGQNLYAKNLTEPDSEIAVLETNLGRIVLEFYPNAAPNHVANFKKLAKSGFYDGTKFHRIIPGFMIQGGDPNSKDEDRSNDGTGNAGSTLKAEFSTIPHKRGILSMARGGHSVDSASCQFFIMHADAPHLDANYSVFGNVIQGMDVVDKIANAKKDAKDNPITPIVIKKVTIEKRTAQSTPK